MITDPLQEKLGEAGAVVNTVQPAQGSGTQQLHRGAQLRCSLHNRIIPLHEQKAWQRFCKENQV